MPLHDLKTTKDQTYEAPESAFYLPRNQVFLALTDFFGGIDRAAPDTSLGDTCDVTACLVSHR
jgi:hypothetical protein